MIRDSLNLTAVGPVATPAGPIEPPERTHPVAERREDPAVLPSATRPIELPAGTSESVFAGRYGVDFAVFCLGGEPRQALLGNWADTAWGGAVTEREEQQHILRVRGSGGFTTVIVPWRRNAKPVGLKVTAEDDTIVVATAAGTTRILPDDCTVE